MSYTKLIPKSDKILIDGTDVSNSFNQMGLEMQDSKEDVSGFSASGNDEFLNGTRAQAFVGQAFHTEELMAILGPLYLNRTAFSMSWQPNGLVDATREIWSGTVTLEGLSPSNTRGSASTFPFTANASTSSGITVSDWT